MKNIILEPSEVDKLFDGITLVIDNWYFKEKKFIKVDDILNGGSPVIDDGYVDEINEELDRNDCTKADWMKNLMEDHYKGSYDILEKFKGFEVKLTIKGEHHHDGQLVDYVIDLISPSGKKTKLVEPMCLGDGFEAQEEVEIKT